MGQSTPQKNAVLSTEPSTDRGIGSALLKTPSLTHTVRYLQGVAPQIRYRFPYGWFVQHNVQTQQLVADLAFADLDQTVNIAIIGPEHYGKTSLIFAGMMALTVQRKPSELQFVFFALNHPDFLPLQPSAYTYLLIHQADQVTEGITRLRAEIQRRIEVARGGNESTQQDSAQIGMPMLVIYLADVTAIGQELGEEEFEDLLVLLMSQKPECGVRVILESPTLAQVPPRCRTLLSDQMYGPSLSDKEDIEKEIPINAPLRPGTIRPSRLPQDHPGVFTVISDTGDGITLRGVNVSPEIRHRWMALQPAKSPPPSLSKAHRHAVHTP